MPTWHTPSNPCPCPPGILHCDAQVRGGEEGLLKLHHFLVTRQLAVVEQLALDARVHLQESGHVGLFLLALKGMQQEKQDSRHARSDGQPDTNSRQAWCFIFIQLVSPAPYQTPSLPPSLS